MRDKYKSKTDVEQHDHDITYSTIKTTPDRQLLSAIQKADISNTHTKNPPNLAHVTNYQAGACCLYTYPTPELPHHLRHNAIII